MEKIERKEKILEVKDLRISFKTSSGTVKAVRGISFDLYKGKTLAIVGESGSGKSVTSRAILGILANNKIVEGGQILYDGKDLLALKEEQFTKIRGSKISMIFQDPLSALNPIMRVGKQLTEPMFLKAKASRREAKKDLRSFFKGERVSRKELNVTNSLSLRKLGRNEFNKEKYLLRIKPEYSFKDIDVLKELHNNENLFKQFNHINDLIASYKNAYSNLNKNLLNEAQEKLKEISSLNKNLLKDLFLNKIFKNPTNRPIFKFGHRFVDNESNKIKACKFYNDSIKFSDYKTDLISMMNYDHSKAIEARKEVVKLIKEFDAKYFADFKSFDAKNALKDIKIIQKVIKRCDYSFSQEKDDIVLVYPVSLRNYIIQYKDSIKLIAQRKKFVSNYINEDGSFKEIPAKIRAGIRETIVKPEEFLKTMTSYNHEIISYIEEDLKNDAFNADSSFESFTKFFSNEFVKSKIRVRKKEAKDRALKLLKAVGIPDEKRRYKQYPFEFSGGMRQRIVIAIALSSNPEILICDEPTTALDVTIQAQILELINKLKDEMNLSIIFITHDLGVVANMADDIAVMYAGKIVEYGTVYDIFYDPRHPYTWALLGSMPDLNTKEKLEAIPGTPPNMLLPPKGDAFALRNKYAMEIDFEKQPPFYKISDTHFAATWLLDVKAPDVKAPKVVRDRILRSLKEHPENIPTYTLEKNSVLGGLNNGK